MSAQPPRLRASNADRDSVVDALSAAHDCGRLDAHEFENRRTAARRATYVDELPPLVGDLPEGQALHTDLEVRSGKEIQPYIPPGTPVATSPGMGEPQMGLALMSGRDVIVPPGTPEVRTFCLMGGDDIDLTDVMGPGVEITLDLYSMWGGHDIWVPEGVRVIDKTINIMAGNDVKEAARGDGSNGTVVLKGFSLMAGHDVRLSRRTPPATGAGRAFDLR